MSRNVANKAEWSDFQDGACLGGQGSDNGVLVLDKACSLGARVTLEEGGDHPWLVSCGVAGAVFVHTMSASSRAEGEAMVKAVMQDISDFLERMEDDDVSQEQAILFAGVWADAFIAKYDGTAGSLYKVRLRDAFPDFFLA